MEYRHIFSYAVILHKYAQYPNNCVNFNWEITYCLFLTSTPDDPRYTAMPQLYGQSRIRLGEVDFMILVLNAATHGKIIAARQIILRILLAQNSE